mmetsp:Transcript_19169/g.37894  ORF Transcript_19169/g.37894 Transcript_19169/m.37894 type:complete len:612 (-) Transcript_19169:4115-5950(-)
MFRFTDPVNELEELFQRGKAKRKTKRHNATKDKENAVDGGLKHNMNYYWQPQKSAKNQNSSGSKPVQSPTEESVWDCFAQETAEGQACAREGFVAFDPESFRIMSALLTCLLKSTKSRYAMQKRRTVVGPLLSTTEKAVNTGLAAAEYCFFSPLLRKLKQYPSLLDKVASAVNMTKRLGHSVDKKMSKTAISVFMRMLESQPGEPGFDEGQSTDTASLRGQLSTLSAHERELLDDTWQQLQRTIDNLEAEKYTLVLTVNRLVKQKSRLSQRLVENQATAVLAARRPAGGDPSLPPGQRMPFADLGRKSKARSQVGETPANSYVSDSAFDKSDCDFSISDMSVESCDEQFSRVVEDGQTEGLVHEHRRETAAASTTQPGEEECKSECAAVEPGSDPDSAAAVSTQPAGRANRSTVDEEISRRLEKTSALLEETEKKLGGVNSGLSQLYVATKNFFSASLSCGSDDDSTLEEAQQELKQQLAAAIQQQTTYDVAAGSQEKVQSMQEQLNKVKADKKLLERELAGVPSLSARCHEAEEAVLLLYEQRKQLQLQNRKLQEKVIEVESFFKSNQGKTAIDMENELAAVNLKLVECRVQLDDYRDEIEALQEQLRRQ